MDKRLERILPRVQKPARYVGGEYNAVKKDPAQVDTRIAFCFPDTYEIGMSNLGVRILYGLMNEMDGVWCERVFAPWGDMEEEMRQFKSGEADIMVATSVIEVGVDVPNATVMVIESAERFGLSQLHQLRGRVGRGGEQSYCILMSGEKLSKESRARLDAMCETNDGFRLAELDLKLRGAGDINGTLQSGMAFDLKIANPTLDVQILTVSREAAAGILSADRTLSRPEHRGLRELRRRYSGREEIDFSMIS